MATAKPMNVKSVTANLITDAIEPALPFWTEVVIPRRQTFYGADEIFFRSPDGTLVGLAAFEEEEGEG